jgi:4-diphosphocytidyl-2-C-methyl-D-erythritol kinase
MTRIERPAPAKLNLTLEVLGKRQDGFHEIRSVVCTIQLCDHLVAEDGTGLVVSADESYDAGRLPSAPGELNTVETALALMVEERTRLHGEPRPAEGSALRRGLSEVALRLEKRIPAAAGLGGGSSDGTAALLALNEYWRLGLSPVQIHGLAARIGSDCPFFVDGGVQYMCGRGEILEALPRAALSNLFLCIVQPAVSLQRKTARLYSLLRSGHYSSGEQSKRLAQRLRGNRPVALDAEDFFNVFDGVAGEAYGDLDSLRSALLVAGAVAVHLCGSGPALYGVFRSSGDAGRACSCMVAEGYAAWAAIAPGP